ncbi:sigma-54-dependent Fis family transcriptional regulator [Hahella sp. CR1]|uniref:sigma-54 interaction domain-containing protein n=1 Tax=Hahella sp. CR1 TaxID=2992807 RepID=UPI002441D481|nr:sigma-54-dependent Fis family transcriptional regulator [Hahella sp. CR1]MDG9669924.1 sigma-54-dependent Fis family transcriptional regulator [Hahella sp. CR1]
MTESSYPTLPAISSMLEAIPAPAVLLDREYRIRAANDAYRRTFQQDGALLNRHCYEVSHGYSVPCDQAGETCPLRQCQESGRRQRMLHIHNTPKGREHVDVELSPIRDEEGEIRFYVEIMQPAHPGRRERSERRMIGFSNAYTHMLELLSRAAPADISVLLLGESGTGKELAAEYLHERSPRASKPFVTVECSGLTDSLFESELFGHEKGAFTGATHRKMGLVEAAAGGTLFLDEVGDIPLSMQVKLLRLLESGAYRPVGGVTPKQADFRLVCATHQPLQELVREGRFRQDLYYRISPFPVRLPALRERGDDVLHLARHLLDSLSKQRILNFAENAEHWLRRQSFPGNIRELRNRIERAILLCDGAEIEASHLQLDDEAMTDNRPLIAAAEEKLLTLEEAELCYLQQSLERHQGDNASLAKALGVSERTLYRKIRTLK